LPPSRYEAPTPEEIVAAVEQAAGGSGPAQALLQQLQGESGSGGGNYPNSTPLYDAPSGPANVIGYHTPGMPIPLTPGVYGGTGQTPWERHSGIGGGVAYGGTDQPYTSNANSSSNPAGGGGGGWGGFW
jgi:hypothetical protein